MSRRAMRSYVIACYRKKYPKSRAVDHTTWYGSTGRRRIATCIYCRREVASSSQAWPETVSSYIARTEHWKKCEEAQPFIIQALLELEALNREQLSRLSNLANTQR